VETEHLLLNITDNANPYFQLVGLEAGTSFVVNVYAMNAKGVSKKRVLEGYTDRDFTERRIAQVRHPPMSQVPKEIPFAQLLSRFGISESLVLFDLSNISPHQTTQESNEKNSQLHILVIPTLYFGLDISIDI